MFSEIKYFGVILPVHHRVVLIIAVAHFNSGQFGSTNMNHHIKIIRIANSVYRKFHGRLTDQGEPDGVCATNHQ